ncbi:MAG: hypothetical protein WKF58_14735 [Ilumatobacteraceae bacterium]
MHTARGEEFRADVAAVLERHELPVSVSGFGSMMSLHARATAPVDATEAAQRDPALQELLFLGLYERGIYTAPRGMINLSLALTDDHLVQSLDALDATLTDISDPRVDRVLIAIAPQDSPDRHEKVQESDSGTGGGDEGGVDDLGGAEVEHAVELVDAA